MCDGNCQSHEIVIGHFVLVTLRYKLYEELIKRGVKLASIEHPSSFPGLAQSFIVACQPKLQKTFRNMLEISKKTANSTHDLFLQYTRMDPDRVELFLTERVEGACPVTN